MSGWKDFEDVVKGTDPKYYPIARCDCEYNDIVIYIMHIARVGNYAPMWSVGPEAVGKGFDTKEEAIQWVEYNPYKPRRAKVINCF